MTALPIVARELLVTARRLGTNRLRLVAALVALGVWAFLWLVTSGMPSSGQRAQAQFIALGVLALGFCLLAGVFLTADCLSEEKRDGTLGLLFLTDLKGYDVVLGKLAATSLRAFYAVLAVLPVLALPLLMGGVAPGEFGRVALVLVATLLLTLSLGMLMSAASREARQAIAGTLFALIVLGAVLPVLWWLVAGVFRVATIEGLLWTSPAYAYRCAFDGAYTKRGGPHQFWASLLGISLLALGALITACVLLPRAWQEKTHPGNTASRQRFWQALRFGDVDARRQQRQQRLEANPFYWLAGRDRLPQLTAWALLCPQFTIWLGFVLGAFFSSSSTMRDVSFGVACFLGYGLHLSLKYLIASEATRRFREDRRSGALELALVMPRSADEIVDGQERAMTTFFRGPMALVLMTNPGLLCLLIGQTGPRWGSGFTFTGLLVCLGGAVLLPLDAAALSRVGMWMGLCARTHYRAVLSTLGQVMLLPWLGLLFIVFLGICGGGLIRGDLSGLLLGWLFVGFINDLYRVVQADAHLIEALREAAASADFGLEARIRVGSSSLPPPWNT